MIPYSHSIENALFALTTLRFKSTLIENTINCITYQIVPCDFINKQVQKPAHSDVVLQLKQSLKLIHLHIIQCSVGFITKKPLNSTIHIKISQHC